MRHSVFGYILSQFSDASARLNRGPAAVNLQRHTSTPTAISSADCLLCTASHPYPGFLYPVSFLGSAEHFSPFGLFQDSSWKKTVSVVLLLVL